MNAVIEGLLYVSGDDGLTVDQVMDILGVSSEEALKLIYDLKNYYDNENRGLRIKYLGNCFKFTTREEHRNYYQKLLLNPKSYSLSQSSLEVLAIIAYNEPVTRVMIDSIRGVDSSYVIRKLLARGFIKESGKSDMPGRPILYKTTDLFLDYFNLATKDDLPDISSFSSNSLDIDDSNKDLFTSIYKEDI